NMRELLKIVFSSASNMESIAIPALGTGNLQYPADVVAKTMYEEAIVFSKTHPHCSLRDIQFVVFHKDLKTIQAFEDEINNLKFPTRKEAKKLKKKRHKPVKTEYTGDQTRNDEVSSPYKGFNKVDKYHAEMKVGNITVTIKKGDITQDDSDAIVNITSGNFDLSNGAVSKAILNNGGIGIQKECRQNMKSPKDEVWTGPGRLNCGGICHVPTDSFSNLKPVLVRVLKTAEKRQNETFAFPAIGTGVSSRSSKESAMFILDCICSFAIKQKPTNLRDIRIIVFEKSMTAEFISVMKEIEGKPFRQRNFLQKGFDFVKSWMGAGEGENDDDSPITPTLTLKILAMNEDQIQNAKDSIQSIISLETTEKIIRHDVFNRFTNKYVMKLTAIGAKHEVVVDITNIRSSKVELHGRTNNVADAQGEVFELINKFLDEEREQNENKLILKKVKWYYASDDTDLVEFEEDIVILLEKAYKKRAKKVKYDASNNHSYEVDLESMEETDLKTNRSVPVIRTDLTAGQILPRTWSTMAPTDKLKVVDLNQGKEYQDVERQFLASLAGTYAHQSIKISRIQNIELWKQYAAKKEAFGKEMPGKQVERVLYHGTDESTIDKINNGGFNRSYAGKNAAAYGAGTYFAANASYSASDTYSRPNTQGQKHMFFCHVLVGNYARGASGMLAPPVQPNSTFHSVVDNVANPSIFVIFNDVQAYPSYLITFK
ncbi:protein mono-ADP-ribosyltransferase PARP14-like, partial [Anneissia japonica]|uniref:protein mono-ADP-ribosyltransferase PARP14-like n=1 Tax=Anneissia japonica TaxID=1529436 RepID=UPI001425B02B